jgi:uncharacterized membrane protein YagU involved in acid resistance
LLPLISAFVDIALHRRGPEHLPASSFLFGLLLAANLAVNAIAVQIADDPALPFAAVLIQMSLELAFIWCVLRAFERQKRFIQSAAAVLGTDTLLTMIDWPLLVWHRSLDAPATDPTLPLLLDALIWVWSIDISAAIMSRALERPYVVAVAIVIGYVMLSLSLRVTLFPPAN